MVGIMMLSSSFGSSSGPLAFDFVNPTQSGGIVSSTWTDSINGIVATIQGSPTYDSNYGGGINFTEAIPTWVDVPISRNGTGGFTISMAATVPQSAAHYVPLFAGNTVSRTGNYIYSRKWTTFETGTIASGVIGLNLDMGKLAWYDFVYNGTSITLYRNGRLLSSGTLSAANQGWLNPLRFGADESTPGNTMATGALYRMKHQTTALNATQISTQFETVRSTYGGGPLAGSLSFPGGVAGTRMLDLSTGFTLGSGSYTVEGWFQLPDFNNQYALFGANASAGDGNGMMNLIVGSSTSIFSDKNGGGGSVTYTVPTMSANTWYHFALTRNGTTEALFINGVRAGASVTNALNYTAATTRIGMSYVRSWPGYMTNFRAVVGSYVYDPSYAYCTVPIGPLTNITNTKYLMLGAVATTDSSGTNTVTNTGSVSQIATVPF
jgi:Concanavalin A-like lectin/glucanases superfamily